MNSYRLYMHTTGTSYFSLLNEALKPLAQVASFAKPDLHGAHHDSSCSCLHVSPLKTTTTIFDASKRLVFSREKKCSELNQLKVGNFRALQFIEKGVMEDGGISSGFLFEKVTSE